MLKLDYSYIQNNRTALMGFCIIWIYFFHVTTNNPIIDPITQIGWCGVDCFFLLSGLGLSYSLSKDCNILQFYKRRVLRILPTWWFLIFCFHLISLYLQKPCPHTFLEVILYYSGIGWFFNGYFDIEKVAWSEWYVPTLLLFYLLAPFINKMKIRNILLCVIVLLFLSGSLSYMHLCDSLKLTYFRLPAFFIGFVIYKLSQLKNITATPCAVTIMFNITLLVIGVIALFYISDLSITTKHPDSIIEAIGSLLIAPGVLFLVSLACKLKLISFILNSFGKISLELYLIHVFFISIAWRMRTELSMPDTLAITLSLVIYWVLSWTVSITIKKLSFKIKKQSS